MNAGLAAVDLGLTRSNCLLQESSVSVLRRKTSLTMDAQDTDVCSKDPIFEGNETLLISQSSDLLAFLCRK